MSINVEYTLNEVIMLVCENIFKMLENRHLINSWTEELKKFNNIENNIYEFVLKDKTICGLYFLNNKLSSIVKSSQLDEYLSTNINNKKIVIGRDVQKKVVKQIFTEYKNAEFFFETDLMEDKPSKGLIPHHKLLDPEEKQEILSKFSENEFSKISVTDAMSRYYGAKIGDIFRITRPSITAGYSIAYRRVVNGTIDIMFES